MGLNWKVTRGLALAALSAAGCGGTVITGTGDEGGSAGARASSDPNPPAASAGRASTADPNELDAPSTSPNSGSAGRGNTAPPGSAGAASASAGSAGANANGAGPGTGFPSSSAVPLVPTDGWVDGMSNALGIQGGVFAYADPTTSVGMTSNFTGTNACIAGLAALVDMASLRCATQMFTPPATDCYGEYWGAAIGMNLNQPVDPVTALADTPLPFDASALRGFSFELSGAVLPAPKDLRFQVESTSHVFCNLPTNKLRAGTNTLLFSEVVSQCFKIAADPPNPTAETNQSELIKISWQVITNTTATVPFDFCVSNVRALRK